MLKSDPIQAVANALLKARADHVLCDAAHLAGHLVTADDAYRVQALVAGRLANAAASSPPCWKSGGASRDAAFTHAALPADGVWSSPADASAWPFHLRLIEIEIALRLRRQITAAEAVDLTQDSARVLVDAMAVSIEIVDSRFQQGLAAPALLKLADLQTHGALVLGDWVPFVARDWATQVASVRIGAKPPMEFRGSHSMNDPAWVLPAWLRHATREGAPAPAGTVVTTGTWCGILLAGRGDRVTARFDGVGQAVVQL